MTCLRAARAQGVVPPSKEGLWGGLVPLPFIQQALVHKHDQVSMALFVSLQYCIVFLCILSDVYTSFLLLLCVAAIAQVRMDALGLLCESRRSTEVLTSQEMDLIRYFLLPSLNSQSPGVRQQTVSLLKKVSQFVFVFENMKYKMYMFWLLMTS